MTPGQAATVSVVIAAYNEERHIGALLSSLEEQTLGPAEVIVRDDGSGDATAELPGRAIYHAGVLVGLAQSSLRPERNWK
jgi:GT2 family glycosyltransferase